MLRTPTFWNQEKEAPLFTRNEGFVESSGDKIFEIANSWPCLAHVDPSDIKNIVWPAPTDISEENQRIVIKDAERTFLGDAQRASLIKVLTAVIKEFGDYGQGLSYVTSFLMLTLDEPTVVAILTKLNSEERYLKGYWKHEAVGFATDAHVFDHLLSAHFKDVAEHLAKHFILPETYCQKWFVGLNIHVLPFEAEFEFFGDFLRVGQPYLLQFGLSLIDHLKSDLLATRDASRLYALLRLDKKVVPDATALSIVKKAAEFESKVKEVDLPELRKKMFETKLKARLEAAKKAFEEAAAEKARKAERKKKREEKKEERKKKKGEEAESSDEDGGGSSTDESDSGDDDSDGEGDDGGECQICKDMVPEVFCKDCKLLVCGSCHDDEKGTHKKTHKVVDDTQEMEELAKAVKEVKV